MTQQPPPHQQGGYYPSQYSQQAPYPAQEPSYPPQQAPYPAQQPSYPPQQPAYPPPQYGQQPYGQQPPPYPQQPYSPQPQPGYEGQAGYGGQPPYGNQPGYFPGAEAPQPPKRSKKLWVILGSVGGVLVLGAVFIVGRSLLSDAANQLDIGKQTPDVGECITEASLVGTETEVVGCDSAEAAWRVIGNDGTWTEADFDAAPVEELCQAFDGTEYMLWIGEQTSDSSGEGQVVCLEQVVAE